MSDNVTIPKGCSAPVCLRVASIQKATKLEIDQSKAWQLEKEKNEPLIPKGYGIMSDIIWKRYI
jgi:hypothetical protein